MEHQPRYIPANTNQGWGIAGLVVGLAVLCIVGATIIHRQTYKPATDVSWRAAGSRSGSEAGHTTGDAPAAAPAGSGEHAPAAAGEHAPAAH